MLVSLFLAVAIAPATAAAHPDPDIAALSVRIASRPGDAHLVLVRADLYRRAAEPTAALDDLRLADGLLGVDDPERVQLAWLRAQTLFDVGDRVAALGELDALLANHPHMPALALRARIHADAGRFEMAVRDYDRALTIGDDVELYLVRGRLLEDHGRRGEAIEGYEAGLQGMGGAVVLRLAVIRVALAAGDGQRALRHVEQGMARAGQAPDWLLLRAEALTALGRRAEAQAARTAALTEIERRYRRRPSRANLLMRARALLALGRPAEAVRDAEQVVRLDRRTPGALAFVAQARREAARQGRAGGAR